MYDLKSWARNEKGWGTAAARQKMIWELPHKDEI